MGDSRPSKADQILDAVLRVLAREGYGGITIANVAEEAGVSRGLLHYYFKSKEDMLVQLIRRSSKEESSLVPGISARSGSIPEFSQGAAEAMMEMGRKKKASLALLVETMAVARTNRRIREVFGDVYQRSHETWAKELGRWREDTSESAVSPEGLATTLKGLSYGLSMTMVVLPHLHQSQEVSQSFRDLVSRALT